MRDYNKILLCLDLTDDSETLAVRAKSLAAAFGAVLLATQGGTIEWRAEARHLNWTAIALAAAIVGLDLGFLHLYRSGFEVSLGALVTQTAAAMTNVSGRPGSGIASGHSRGAAMRTAATKGDASARQRPRRGTSDDVARGDFRPSTGHPSA